MAYIQRDLCVKLQAEKLTDKLRNLSSFLIHNYKSYRYFNRETRHNRSFICRLCNATTFHHYNSTITTSILELVAQTTNYALDDNPTLWLMKSTFT